MLRAQNRVLRCAQPASRRLLRKTATFTQMLRQRNIKLMPCHRYLFVEFLGTIGIFFFYFFSRHDYFPAQLVGGFTLSNLLDKSWSQVSSLLPQGTCIQFLSRIGLAFPLLVDFHRMLLTHALTLSANQFLCKKRSLRVCALGEN